MRTYRKKPPELRYWPKVNQNGPIPAHCPEIGPCWLWMGAKSNGYGHFWDGERTLPAHWFLLDPRPQKGQGAYHRCDQENCVRPSHIFIGYPVDNTNDMVAKGRENWLEGAECSYAKITESQAMMIKACPRRRGAMMRMAIALGIADNTACEIRNGNRWRHLPSPTPDDHARAEAFLASLA